MTQDTSISTLKRLAALQEAANYEAFAQGVLVGTQWAEEIATLRQLRRLADPNQVDHHTQSGRALFDWLVTDHPHLVGMDWNQSNRSDVWDYEGMDDYDWDNWRLGFRSGASDVFHLVRNEIDRFASQNVRRETLAGTSSYDGIREKGSDQAVSESSLNGDQLVFLRIPESDNYDFFVFKRSSLCHDEIGDSMHTLDTDEGIFVSSLYPSMTTLVDLHFDTHVFQRCDENGTPCSWRVVMRHFDFGLSLIDEWESAIPCKSMPVVLIHSKSEVEREEMGAEEDLLNGRYRGLYERVHDYFFDDPS